MAGFTQKTIEFIKGIITRRQEKSSGEEDKFAIVITGLPEETFTLVKFTTQGELNQCYRAELIMITQTPRLDIKKVLMSHAFAYIKRDEKTFAPFSGIIVELEEMRRFHDYIFYRAVVAPRLWLLTISRGNQIFLDKTLQEILEEVLVGGGLTKNEFEFRLQGDYSRRLEYVCQYGESHFTFLSRWLEHAGMYFYPEHTDEGDKLIITDTKIAHIPPPYSFPLQYHPHSGMETGHWDRVLSSFSACYYTLPKSVTLKDYNYRNPSLDLTGKADVAEHGVGDVFIYGGHFQTPEEANRVAKIRAEELSCRQIVFHGESRAPFLRPGSIFEVQGHYQEEYCGKYMITSINHEGNQAVYLTAGLRQELAKEDQEIFYHNKFTAIPADIQYRPPLITPKPRFFGVINAHIDAESSGQYAELDKQGRYKVMLPFDQSGRQGGKASSWIRMAQPYVGDNYGMHFPLHKGTEVLLTFIDGDPDRPIITGAVPNSLNPSVLNDQNYTNAGFSTPGGSCLVAHDTAGKEQIALTQGGNTSLTLSGSETVATSPNWFQIASGLSLGLSGMFKYTYSLSTSVHVVGFKAKPPGLLSMLVGAINTIPDFLKSKGASPLTETVLSVVVSMSSILEYFYMISIVKKCINSKLSGIDPPKVGYGIYADDHGVLTYMEDPLFKLKTGYADIAVVSDTGSIWLTADNNINLMASKTLNAAAKDDVFITTIDGKVDIYGFKEIEIKSGVEGDGVNITSQAKGVKIVAEKNADIELESIGGAIGLRAKNESSKGAGEIFIGDDVYVTAEDKSQIILRTKETDIHITSEKIELNAEKGLTIKVGENIVEIDKDGGITITASNGVKINKLTVTDKDLTFTGETVNLGGAFRVKK